MRGKGVDMKKILLLAMVFCFLLSVTAAHALWDPRDRELEEQAVKETIDRFLIIDPSLKVFFDQAAGYVVFPTVGKGAYIVGVGYGRGWFFEKGKPIGKANVTQLSAGAQIGGQAYSEIIFFRDPEIVDYFKTSQFEVSAQVSAVALNAGVGRSATYIEGVAVFIQPKGGLMVDASVGGQRFGFEPF